MKRLRKTFTYLLTYNKLTRQFNVPLEMIVDYSAEIKKWSKYFASQVDSDLVAMLRYSIIKLC